MYLARPIDIRYIGLGNLKNPNIVNNRYYLASLDRFLAKLLRYSLLDTYF